jgi:2-polyprenyl-3-methyl-5-hydroxy-6-metoxy-1,4-benzoquinol methylase
MTDKGEGQSSSHHSHGHHQHHGGNFDHAADDYDERAQTLFVFHKAVVQELQERLQSSKTTVAATERPTLFEFGCGTGNVCLPLAVHCQHVYGVDVSANMLAKAHAKIQSQSIGNATLQQMEMTDIQQLASHQMPTTYDWVVCCMVLHHLTQPMETLKF